MQLCKLHKHTSWSLSDLWSLWINHNKSHNALLMVLKIDEICSHIRWPDFCWWSMAMHLILLQLRLNVVNLEYLTILHTCMWSLVTQSSRTSLGRRWPGVVGATLCNHQLGISSGTGFKIPCMSQVRGAKNGTDTLPRITRITLSNLQHSSRF